MNIFYTALFTCILAVSCAHNEKADPPSYSMHYYAIYSKKDTSHVYSYLIVRRVHLKNSFYDVSVSQHGDRVKKGEMRHVLIRNDTVFVVIDNKQKGSTECIPYLSAQTKSCLTFLDTVSQMSWIFNFPTQTCFLKDTALKGVPAAHVFLISQQKTNGVAYKSYYDNEYYLIQSVFNKVGPVSKIVSIPANKEIKIKEAEQLLNSHEQFKDVSLK